METAWRSSGRFTLGIMTASKEVAGRFDHLDQVPVEVRRVQGVGPEEPGTAAPVELFRARTTSPRAAALLSGATASSRSRKTASASEASAFSTIFRLVAGTARRERAAFMLFVEQRLYGLSAQGGVENLHRVGHR